MPGHPIRSLLTVILLITCGTGCSTWQPVAYPPPMDPDFRFPGNVRIMEVGGRAHYGKDPFGRGDYLVLSRYDGTLDSVARSRVVSIESGVTNDQKSFLIVGAVVLAVTLLVIAMANAEYAPMCC